MTRKKIEKEPFDVQKALSEALISLMDKKPYREIKATEIVDTAAVARCTFYRYFTDKEELLKYCLTNLFEGLSKRLQQEDCRTFYGMSLGYFSYWQERKDFLVILQKSGMMYFLLQTYEELMFGVAKEVKPEHSEMKVNDFSPKVRYHFFFGMGGFWEMTNRWIMGGCKETTEELAQYVVAYLVESYQSEPDCQYYERNGSYPYEPCYIKPGNEF